MAGPAELLPAPDQVAPVPVTYTEGSKAFLRGPGGLVEVPAELAERYIAEQGYTPASGEQVAERRDIAKQEGLAGGAVAAAENLAMGLPDALMALPRGAAALGYAATGSEGLKDFVESTSTDQFFRDIAWLQGGSQKEQEFVRARRAQEAAWPTLSALSRGVGQAAGAGLAVGGAAGIGAGTGVRLGTQAARLGVGGAVEGLAFGTTAPFDTVEQLENTPQLREAVLANGLLGAVLGGAGGAASPFIARGAGRFAELGADGTERLRRVFGRGRATEAAGEALDAADAPAARAAQAWDNLTEDVAKAAEQAGPNPKAIREAAEEAATESGTRIRQAAGEVTPENWDKVELNDTGKWLHRDTLIEGAKRAVTKDLDDVLRVSREATKELREAPLKRELVAKNLAESGIDETRAIGAAQQRVAQTMANAVELVNAAGGLKESGKTVKSITTILEKASRELDTVDNAADAYIAVDQARRALHKMVPGLANQARNSMAHLADQGRALLEFVEGEYRGLADHLFDDSLWGKQGAAQAAVNKSWVGAIDADRVGLKNFTGIGSYDIYNRPLFAADPDKIGGYLEKLGSASLRDVEFRRILDTQEALAKAMREGYELSPAARKGLDESIGAVNRMRKTLDKAEQVVASANAVQRSNSAESALAMGRIGNAITGLASDGIRGALAGAFFPGGRAGALQTMASLRTLSDANRGLMAEAMARAAESVMGASPKSRAAVKAAEKSVRETGLLTPVGESVTKRVRTGLLAAVPSARALLESTRDLPRAEQLEKYQERRDILASLVSSPDRMRSTLTRTLAPVMEADPQLGVSLMVDIAGKLNRLYAAMPGKKQLSAVPKRAQDVVSDTDLRTAEAMIQATLDPMSVFEDFRKGQVSYEKVAFAKEQWPALFEQARAALMDILPRIEDDVTDEALAQLDTLLGMKGALDPALAPDFLARSMERGEVLARQMAAAQPKAPTGGASQIAQRQQTYTNRLMGV